jgi:hypothetical protein
MPYLRVKACPKALHRIVGASLATPRQVIFLPLASADRDSAVVAVGMVSDLFVGLPVLQRMRAGGRAIASAVVRMAWGILLVVGPNRPFDVRRFSRL